MTTMSVSGWMFLLVPAHRGFPGQIPQSRKTFVCVCVCLYLMPTSFAYAFLLNSHYTTLHQFNSLFSSTTWVSRHRKGKPFWCHCYHHLLLHARDDGSSDISWTMQIICISLRTDNHTSTSSLIFLKARCPSCCPTNSVKAMKHTSFKFSMISNFRELKIILLNQKSS